MVKSGTTMNSTLEKPLQLIDAVLPRTGEQFRPFGQVIYPTADGKVWDEQEAKLDLSQGIPRLYIMTLQFSGLCFDRMTRHCRCTQCLGAIGGERWFLGVAAPTVAPDRLSTADVTVFEIRGHCLIKLEVGTWHAGPYFLAAEMNFFNLELSDTNINDHHSVALERSVSINPK